MYQDLKYVLSDRICELLSSIASELFGTSCPRLIDGFFVTFELLFLSAIIGLFIAVGVAFAKLSKVRALSFPASIFAYVFRGTPLLVQLWIMYFGVGSLEEEGMGSTLWMFFKDPWLVGLLVLVLNTGAYTSEILRGGLVNIPVGQMEAATAIGMTWFQTMRRIMLPQAIRIAWPAYGNEVILLMKGSALVSTITVMDLMGQTRTEFAKNFNLEVYVYAALLYLGLAGLLTAILSFMGRKWEKNIG